MKALIIIDMQEASFCDFDQHDSAGVVDRINMLSARTRENGGKVIFIQHDGTEEEGLFPQTPGWNILSSLTKNDSDIVVRKTTNDSFCKTLLHKTLNDLSAEEIIISGWATDFCVDTTIRAAVSLGHNVVVVSDCHTLCDRPHLSAAKIIEHHNWVWQNLLSPNKVVRVLPHDEL